MLEAQNRRIDDLMERIRLQQEKLDKQNVRIRTLQNQVTSLYNSAHIIFCKPADTSRSEVISYLV